MQPIPGTAGDARADPDGLSERLLRLTKGGLHPVSVEETDHFRLMREFWSGPKEFVAAMLEA